MPLYEYQCENCGEVFELMQKFSDEPTTKHEKCGGNVHRLLSAPALQFKGSGWYITDYAKGGSGGAKDPSAKKDGAAATKTDSKSDSSSSSSSSSTSSTPAASSTPSTGSSDK